jgi:glutamate-5-semialdehyde dehydrogenase
MINVDELAKKAKAASKKLALVNTDQKNLALQHLADGLLLAEKGILEANAIDIQAATDKGMTPALVDRLLLNEKRWQGVIADLRHVIDLPDPVGETFEAEVLENGLKVHKQRVPLGVLAVVYEARPNVTVDVVGLALKSGNAVILRGGSETLNTNRVIVQAIQSALAGTAIPADAVQFIDDPDRKYVLELMKMYDLVDMLIPRGGAGLHKFCRENSLVPVITGGMGICHLYVDESADLEKSVEVIRNAKIQRPSVCNALDTVLVNSVVAEKFLPGLVDKLAKDGVKFKADPRAYAILKGYAAVEPAGEVDFDTEWMALMLGIKVVNTLEEAIDHIQAHSTAHSDGILTSNEAHAAKFVAEVDSAAVYVNASTRFTDGSQLGLGAEIAISTQRMHARGPMGLRELTTYKWVVEGEYHVRG